MLKWAKDKQVSKTEKKKAKQRNNMQKLEMKYYVQVMWNNSM